MLRAPEACEGLADSPVTGEVTFRLPVVCVLPYSYVETADDGGIRRRGFGRCLGYEAGALLNDTDPEKTPHSSVAPSAM